MSFQQRIKEQKPNKPTKVELVDIWINSLPEEERDAAYEMLRDVEGWSAIDVVEAFIAEGHLVSLKTIYAWRKLNNVSI